MKISRRKVVVLGASAVSASLLPINLLAQSDGQSAEDIIKEFTGGANIGSGDIMLTTPEIAENGNTVPISVESKKATAIKILALGNPGPDVVTFKFGPLSATRSASTRIRLRKTPPMCGYRMLNAFGAQYKRKTGDYPAHYFVSNPELASKLIEFLQKYCLYSEVEDQ